MLERLTIQGAQWSARARAVYAVDVLWRAGLDFARHGGTTHAAALAYYVLLSLFPLLIFLVAVFGLMLRDPTIQEQTVALIVDRLPPALELRLEVESVIVRASQTNNGLVSLISLMGMAWAASAIFGALRQALNAAFEAPALPSLVHGKLLDLLGVVAVGELILLSIVMTTALGLVRALTDRLFTGWLSYLGWQVVYFVLPFVVSFGVFLAAYRLIPNVKTRLSDLWVGALVAAVGFELAKYGFGLYFSTIGGYQQVYGALGSVVAFLVFVFIVSTIMIFGAEVASELAKDRQAAADAK